MEWDCYRKSLLQRLGYQKLMALKDYKIGLVSVGDSKRSSGAGYTGILKYWFEGYAHCTMALGYHANSQVVMAGGVHFASMERKNIMNWGVEDMVRFLVKTQRSREKTVMAMSMHGG